MDESLHRFETMVETIPFFLYLQGNDRKPVFLRCRISSIHVPRL